MSVTTSTPYRPIVRPRRLWRGLPWEASGLWLVLTATGLWARPSLAPAETQLLSIAWHMWSSDSWVPAVGDIGTRPVPPLLFWLMSSGWSVFGMGDVWPRLVAPLFALGSLFALAGLGRALWPTLPRAATLAPILLMGSAGFAAYSGFTLLETPLTFFFIVGLYGGVLAWRGQFLLGWSLAGIALGLGFLVKGVMMTALLAPVALGIGWWARGTSRPTTANWVLGMILAGLIGFLLALPWLIPATKAGFPLTADLIFAYAADRLAYAVEKPRPWSALILVPLMLYPWFLWKPLWRALRHQRHVKMDAGLRFILCALGAAVLATLIFASRQPHNLLPFLPPLALLAARLLAGFEGKPKDFHALLPGLPILFLGIAAFLLNIIPVAHLDAVWREHIAGGGLPVWLGGVSVWAGILLVAGGYVLSHMTPIRQKTRVVQVALLPVLLVLAVNIEFAKWLGPFFDVTPMARLIGELQQNGRTVVAYGRYYGEFDFPGRLRQPVIVLSSRREAQKWAAEHPDGLVISYFNGGPLRLPATPLYLGPYGDNWAALWAAQSVTATDGAVLNRRF